MVYLSSAPVLWSLLSSPSAERADMWSFGSMLKEMGFRFGSYLCVRRGNFIIVLCCSTVFRNSRPSSRNHQHVICTKGRFHGESAGVITTQRLLWWSMSWSSRIIPVKIFSVLYLVGVGLILHPFLVNHCGGSRGQHNDDDEVKSYLSSLYWRSRTESGTIWSGYMYE